MKPGENDDLVSSRQSVQALCVTSIDLNPHIWSALHALLETHHSTDVLPEEAALARMHGYPLLVIPERRRPSDQLLAALRAVRKGDFSVRLPSDRTGIAGDIAEAFNDIVDLNERTANELRRMTTVVGRDGRIGQRASIGAVTGGWAGCTRAGPISTALTPSA